MASIFKFKEFDVDQTGCAMKINTDGVLLGALSKSSAPKHILDVGSGTGVVALMLAQRFPESFIDAVEIDEIAYHRAKDNFSQSTFHNRLMGYLGDFEIMNSLSKYDLIVSNPPFYINSLHNPDVRKKIARHSDLDFFERLLAFSGNSLIEDGTLQLILPVDLAQEVVKLAVVMGFSLLGEIEIRSFENSDVIRKIVFLKKGLSAPRINSSFVIYQEKGIYSQEYRMLLKPFFLSF